MKIIYSNHLEFLAEECQKNFVERRNPFFQNIVIVSEPRMKNWITTFLSTKPPGFISLGFKFFYVQEFLSSFLEFFEKKSIRFAEPHEWSFQVEVEVQKILHEESDQKKWKTLFSFFEKKKTNEKKILKFCQILGKIFFDYSFFGEKKWEEIKEEENWQKEIYHRILQRKKWKIPFQIVENLSFKKKENISLHFFSIPFLDPLQKKWVEKLEQAFEVSMYVFSPTSYFWADIQSDRERILFRESLEDKSQKKGLEEVWDEWENYLMDRNPLLANFGKMGKEMLKFLEEKEKETKHAYFLPSSIQKQSSYQELIGPEISFFSSKIVPTLLEKIQTDILLMKTMEEEKETIEKETIFSLQFHVAPTLFREIEIAYQNLLQILDQEKEFQPSDILVMAPSIKEYRHYIEAVFGSKDSQIPYEIMDIKTPQQNPFIHAFSLLIALGKSRFSRYDVFALLEEEAFQKTFDVDTKIIQKLFYLTEKAGILWGVDKEHRSELLQDTFLEEGGTWSSGIEELMRGVSFTDYDLSCSMQDVKYVGMLAEWIRHLRRDLSSLINQEKKSLEDWKQFFIVLCQKYFSPDLKETLSLQKYEELLQFFSFLKDSEEEKFSYESIEKELNERLEKSLHQYQEIKAQAVRFSSFLCMRTIPSKVIYLLGMDEDKFPRREEPVPAFHLFSKKRTKIAPSSYDADRYLFLETILCTRKFFVASCVGYDEKTGKTLSFSLPIQELQEYIKKRFKMENGEILSYCCFSHPFHGFSKEYFVPETKFVNYSKKEFHLCINQEKKELSFPSFSLSIKDEEKKVTLDIESFIGFAKNPMQRFFSDVLGVKLKRKEERKTSEPFSLSPLDRYLFRKSSLQISLSDLFLFAKKRGKLPLGMFQDFVWNKIKTEIDETEKYFQQECIHKENILTLDFRQDLVKFKKIESNYWQIPSPFLQNRYYLTGRLTNISEKGLLIFGKEEFSSFCENWPKWLLLSFAKKMCPEIPGDALVFINKKKSIAAFFNDPEIYLNRFLGYVLLAKKDLSPLYPKWVEFFIRKEKGSLQKLIYEEKENSFTSFQDPYIENLFVSSFQEEQKKWLDSWEKEAQEVYGDLFTFFQERKKS